MGCREQHVVGPGVLDRLDEPVQVEISHGLLKRLRLAGAGDGLGGPVDANAEPTLGKPVGVGTLVGRIRLTLSGPKSSVCKYRLLRKWPWFAERNVG